MARPPLLLSPAMAPAPHSASSALRLSPRAAALRLSPRAAALRLPHRAVASVSASPHSICTPRTHLRRGPAPPAPPLLPFRPLLLPFSIPVRPRVLPRHRLGANSPAATPRTPVAVELPCGMAVGSRVTVVARPRRKEVSAALQFMVELLGTKAVQGEEPPRILHFNPRITGDFSGRPVIELNTCYRMQWAQPQWCEGWASRPDEEKVDGELKCEKWTLWDDGAKSEESKVNWWLSSLIGRPDKVSVDGAYPFAEGKQFLLPITAGSEGYHVNVDERHVASFPYRTGYNLEDATGLSLNGDLDIESISGDHLPKSHPSFDSQIYLEMSEQWKASPLRVVPAKYIMKCDDDTFVRIDSVLDQVKKVPSGGSMYVGNINYYHRPLRSGKWAVTYEEWEEEAYPPYANGPGYVISSDIAQYIVSEFGLVSCCLR